MSTRIIGRFIALASVGAIALTGMPATSAAADTHHPVLTSVSISPASAEPGDTVTVSLAATDDVGLFRSTVALIEETSRQTKSASDTSSPLEVDLVVEPGWANGAYGVLAIHLEDAAGNSAHYSVNGTYHGAPTSASTTHTVDLAGPSTAVTGASDRTPPALTSVSVTSESTRVGVPTSSPSRSPRPRQ